MIVFVSHRTKHHAVKNATSCAEITQVYYWPHEKHPPCNCRKPAPGMLLTAARAHEIALTASWMIGDSDIDMEAGRNAGCRTARILKSDQVASGVADVFAQSLLDAVHRILLLESRPVHFELRSGKTVLKSR